MRARAAAIGRDLSNFRVRIPVPVVKHGDQADLDATLARLPELKAVGCTEANFSPLDFCSGPAEFESFVERIVKARDAVNSA